MTPRQKRRFMKQFQSQVDQERNGKPIDGEVAARMTKPIMEQELFQVIVTNREGKKMLPIAPMMGKQHAEALAEQINKFVLEGKERVWSNADVVPMTLIAGA